MLSVPELLGRKAISPGQWPLRNTFTLLVDENLNGTTQGDLSNITYPPWSSQVTQWFHSQAWLFCTEIFGLPIAPLFGLWLIIHWKGQRFWPVSPQREGCLTRFWFLCPWVPSEGDWAHGLVPVCLGSYTQGYNYLLSFPHFFQKTSYTDHETISAQPFVSDLSSPFADLYFFLKSCF